MKAFLRDLAYLVLFSASVAAVVLLVAIHQGRFEFPGTPTAEAAAPCATAPRAAAARLTEAPALPAASAMAVDPLPPARPVVSLPVETPPTFDPSTRGAPGDARVLFLPEVTWLQEQLGLWIQEARAAGRTAPATLQAAHAAARRASAFDYRVSPECWNIPATFEARGWGDCADKSLWLARELLHAGYAPVGIRLGVPEDYRPGQPGHAWVVLYHHGSEWIYDPATGPRLMSQDASPTRRYRISATIFPR